MRMAQARRWRAVTLNFRSCSGERTRRPQFYHSGHTDDLEAVFALVLAREPATRLLAVGISLGGNVLLKWLRAPPPETPRPLAGALPTPPPSAPPPVRPLLPLRPPPPTSTPPTPP